MLLSLQTLQFSYSSQARIDWVVPSGTLETLKVAIMMAMTQVDKAMPPSVLALSWDHAQDHDLETVQEAH